MSTQDFITKKDKLEFREIVLGHIKRILEISSHDLRDTTTRTIHSNFTEIIEHEDTRHSYIQAIESLAHILLGYFDKRVQTVYDDCIEVLTSYDYQIKEMYKEDIDKIKKDLDLTEVPEKVCMDIKLQHIKKLFCELMLLLKRVEYLKASIYGESEEGEIIEVDKK